MPVVARYMIKTAFAWLIAALASGIAIAAFPSPEGLWPGLGARTAVFHILTVGWLTQLIFGVAYWLFPRWSKERPYGPIWLGWTAFALINAGVVGRALGGGTVAGEAVGGAIQAAGVLVITAAMWPRVRIK
jgi:hypothetical protein